LALDRYGVSNPSNPYKLLAQMRLPIYVTSEQLDFLERALIESGVQPTVRICPWNKWVPEESAIYEDEPTPERPLVYHLFGHVSIPKSLVLSEDQYFDYLIGVTLNKSLIPSAVRAALTNTALLFLGFQMDDWEFRVFFRYLMAQEGREMLRFYSHATAQVEPEEDRFLDVQRTHKYLEEYFRSEHIGIFWGSTEEFLKALFQHLPMRK
jgi:SIR2-like domain